MNKTISITNDKSVQEAIDYLIKIKKDDNIDVVFIDRVSTRSNKQNSLYWGAWIQYIRNWENAKIDSQGKSTNDIHNDFKNVFMPQIYFAEQVNKLQLEWAGAYSMVKEMGASKEQLDRVRNLVSTTWATPKQFGQYLEEIERWAISKGLSLPHPDDTYYDALGYTK